MYEDGVDGESLREVLQKACKHVDIGAAVLPKALLCPDIDEHDMGSREGVAQEETVSNLLRKILNLATTEKEEPLSRKQMNELAAELPQPNV